MLQSRMQMNQPCFVFVCHFFGAPMKVPRARLRSPRCQNIFFAIPVTHLIDAAGREGSARWGVKICKKHQQNRKLVDIGSGWWFGTCFSIFFPYLGSNHPNWLILGLLFFKRMTQDEDEEGVSAVGVDVTR